MAETDAWVLATLILAVAGVAVVFITVIGDNWRR